MSTNRRFAAGWQVIYRGQTGQWAQLLHRVTGLLIVLFLLAHIVDTSFVGWGPGLYDTVTRLYDNPIIRMFEVMLVAIVIYHAINGIRVTIIDFWDRASLHQEMLFWGVVVVFFILFAPAAYFMLTL